MSAAARKPFLARLADYARQNGGEDKPLTPAQMRRLVKKAGHGVAALRP